ncbi:hypothetical protein CsSME_00035531 [Camellia sinensis var. sinensis]
MRRLGKHLKHLGRDQCKLWKLMKVARDSRGQNRVTAARRPGKYLKHLGRDQYGPGNTLNTSGGTNIRDLI